MVLGVLVAMMTGGAGTANAQTMTTLTVSVFGGGTVTSNDGKINCGPNTTGDTFGPDCEETYTWTSSPPTVILTATPLPGWRFTGWGAACGVWLGPTCTMTMHGSFPADAFFAPPNDNFGSKESLAGDRAIATGSNVGATQEAGEPNHAGVSDPIESVWYIWTAPNNGTATLDVCMSNYDTTLAVYTGVAVNGLTAVASNDDSEACGVGSVASRVSFSTANGTTYQIAVDGFEDDWGTFVLNLAFTPGPLLTVARSGSGTGTVSGPGINCGVDCMENYVQGTSVTLTATPAPGSTFFGWSGPCTGTGTCTVAMDAAKSITATFAALPSGCTTGGTEGDDTIVGTPGNDVICALGGDDIVRAGGGDDVVYGGEGGDSLVGEAGDDRLFGQGGGDTLRGGVGRDNLQSGAGGDRLEGDASNDVLNGGAGGDSLLGWAGNDRLTGGGGKDAINGMAGNDRLYLRDGGTVDTGNGGPGTDWARRDRRDRVRNVERFG